MKITDIVVASLLVIGGLNWGLVGLFDFNLVEAIFGAGASGRIIYTIVGLAALYPLFFCKAIKSRWRLK